MNSCEPVEPVGIAAVAAVQYSVPGVAAETAALIVAMAESAVSGSETRFAVAGRSAGDGVDPDLVVEGKALPAVG